MTTLIHKKGLKTSLIQMLIFYIYKGVCRRVLLQTPLFRPDPAGTKKPHYTLLPLTT